MRPLRVALAGCGAVGSAFVEQVADWNRRRRGRGALEVVTVLVRDPSRRRRGIDRRSITDDVGAFLAAPAEVVVEAVGGLDPALRIARHALASGRPWVTANKAVVARHGAALATEARRVGVEIGFEAAVGAGIPVVATLRQALAHDEVVALRGILNGTTNFLLTALERGAAWDDALAEARRRGFAEADPSRDLQGLDAADKLRILAWLAFGVDPASLEVDVVPVSRAGAAGAVMRQVAEVRRDSSGIRGCVGPVEVPRDSALGRTTDEGNLIEIDTVGAGRIRLSGPGAGGRATASALLGDVVAGLGLAAGRGP